MEVEFNGWVEFQQFFQKFILRTLLVKCYDKKHTPDLWEDICLIFNQILSILLLEKMIVENCYVKTLAIG